VRACIPFTVGRPHPVGLPEPVRTPTIVNAGVGSSFSSRAVAGTVGRV
jgi:hypothetical protein